MQNDTLNIQLLKEEWNLLETSIFTLQRLVDKCRSISGKTTYTFEEEESFDSLASNSAEHPISLPKRLFAPSVLCFMNHLFRSLILPTNAKRWRSFFHPIT
jgi:hypothetical protein